MPCVSKPCSRGILHNACQGKCKRLRRCIQPSTPHNRHCWYIQAGVIACGRVRYGRQRNGWFLRVHLYVNSSCGHPYRAGGLAGGAQGPCIETAYPYSIRCCVASSVPRQRPSSAKSPSCYFWDAQLTEALSVPSFNGSTPTVCCAGLLFKVANRDFSVFELSFAP